MAAQTADSFLSTKSGFSYIAQGGNRREFQSHQVLGMRIETARQARSDGAQSLTKTLHFRVSDSEWTSVETELCPGSNDRLLAVENRVLDSLVQRSWETLRHGGDVEGAGWTLNLIELCLTDGSQRCELQQVAGVTWQADQLCIWHEDERQKPFAKLPRDSENAVILHRLLSELVENVQPDSREIAEAGMGQRIAVFHTDRGCRLPLRRAAIVAALLLVACTSFISLYATGVCILLTLVVGLTAAPLLRGSRETLSHYERGIDWSCGGEERILLMDQIRSVSADWNRGSMDATMQQPAVCFRFEPIAADQLPIEMTIAIEAAESDADRSNPNVDGQQRCQAEAMQRRVAANIADRWFSSRN